MPHRFETDANYYILGGFPGFEWNYPTNAFGDTSEDLRRAMASNPHMKVLITSGYYGKVFTHSPQRTKSCHSTIS